MKLHQLNAHKKYVGFYKIDDMNERHYSMNQLFVLRTKMSFKIMKNERNRKGMTALFEVKMWNSKFWYCFELNVLTFRRF